MTVTSSPVASVVRRAAEAEADVVVFATRDRVGMFEAGKVLARGAKALDFSGDFRFTTAEAYADYATRHGKDPRHAAPELLANDVDAALIHEAAIGKIAGEQIVKLRTLGLTEEEAEAKIVAGFLK